MSATAITIPSQLAATAERHPDAVALVDGVDHWTYTALHHDATRVAAGLVALGVQPGDRVAIWAPNSARWVIAATGVWSAGAVLVPVNTRFKAAEATAVLARSDARVVFTVSDFLDTDYTSMIDHDALGGRAHVVVMSGAVPETAMAWDAVIGLGGDDECAEVLRRTDVLTADDPADLLFTSGTTGVPKGVMQTHRRTLRVASDWVEMTGLRGGDRYLMVNPYFHMFGLKAGILACIVAGATMLPQQVFDVERVLARVADERITVLPGAPTIYQAILDHPTRDRYDLSSLRVAVTGAADIPVELIRRVLDELPFPTVITGYGLTEAGTATATDLGDDATAIATTVGRPRPGFEVRIVDAAGAEVPAGDAGEILVRGPSAMSEYFADPGATADAIVDGGWLHTGDLGAIDEAGRLRIVGRVKDMFIVGGFNAYPAEIENLLCGHPAVRQAAVIGVPDDRLGEVGMAFVVVDPAATISGAALMAWSREHMANYKAPRAVEFVDSLPTNAAGKVDKEELRARAAR